jgi:hypothetical protein
VGNVQGEAQVTVREGLPMNDRFRVALLQAFAEDVGQPLCDLLRAAHDYRRACTRKSERERDGAWLRLLERARRVASIVRGWAFFGVGLPEMFGDDALNNLELARAAQAAFGERSGDERFDHLRAAALKV